MSEITIRGARLHNLKNISLSIPKDRLVVFSGISGSGKSTMAFDTLHREGQRQYLESLGLVTFGVSRPAVESITGLSPSISLGQVPANRSPRSTVGTATELFTYLRLLWARAGHRPCPACGGDVPPAHEAGLAGDWEDEADELPAADQAGPAETGDGEAPPTACPHCGAGLPGMSMASFSFNKPAGACPSCTGLGAVYVPELSRLLDEEKSIQEGAVAGWVATERDYHIRTLRQAGRHYGFDFDPSLPLRALGAAQRDLLLYGTGSAPFRRHYPGAAEPVTVAGGRFEGVVTTLMRRHAEHAGDAAYLEKLERALVRRTCPDCGGARLRPAARAVTVAGRPLVAPPQAHPVADGAVAGLPLLELAGWLDGLAAALPPGEWLIAEPIVADLRERVRRLVQVGLGYLTQDQAAPSLSAGEALRLRLAALLGSGLTGVLYVLDEPTIGLHPRDTPRLTGMLRALRDLGNTVLVIEHDLEVIAAADWVVDFGPGAGQDGGQIVAQGPPGRVAEEPGSLTGRYLSGALGIPVPPRRRHADGAVLAIHGAREHNLQDITVRFPLREAGSGSGLLVAVTGVSGSGKSSLLFDILDRAARRRFYGASAEPGAHDAITGWEHLDRIVTVDQTPLSRSTRSNAATYTDAFTPIREAFAALPAARARGLTPQHFSFNAAGGRCERCQGSGLLAVEMHFLPDVQVRCPDCRGRRYRREVLEVAYPGEAGGPEGGYDIARVLDLTIAEALPLFESVPGARVRLALMAETGLGYLRLGQPASTFSGGEAQRVKLARELSRHGGGRTLYLLDEPTTGLHPADIVGLLGLLQRLAASGSTVIVIEHNLDVIKTADWVIDLGPEGGPAGGRLVAEGPPETVARAPGSHTGGLLRRVLGAKEA